MKTLSDLDSCLSPQVDSRLVLMQAKLGLIASGGCPLFGKAELESLRKLLVAPTKDWARGLNQAEAEIAAEAIWETINAFHLFPRTLGLKDQMKAAPKAATRIVTALAAGEQPSADTLVAWMDKVLTAKG